MDVWVDSKFVGGVSELTLFTPIKRGFVVHRDDAGREVREARTYEQRLHDHLRSVQKRIDEGILTSVSRIATIHFARWQILLPAHYLHYDRKKVEAAGLKLDEFQSWLLFTSNFDGDLKTYLNEFSAIIAKDVDTIWGNCEGYPDEGSQNFDAYWAYAKKHQITTQSFFNAYPGLSVSRVRELAHFRARFDEFVAMTRLPDGSSKPDIAKDFDVFLSESLAFPQNFPSRGGIFPS